MEEVEAFLALDSSTSYEVDDNYLDSEGDILFLESLLNDDDPSLNSYLNIGLSDSHTDAKYLSYGDISDVDEIPSEPIIDHLIMTPPEYDSPGGDALNHEDCKFPPTHPGCF